MEKKVRSLDAAFLWKKRKGTRRQWFLSLSFLHIMSHERLTTPCIMIPNELIIWWQGGWSHESRWRERETLESGSSHQWERSGARKRWYTETHIHTVSPSIFNITVRDVETKRPAVILCLITLCRAVHSVFLNTRTARTLEVETGTGFPLIFTLFYHRMRWETWRVRCSEKRVHSSTKGRTRDQRLACAQFVARFCRSQHREKWCVDAKWVSHSEPKSRA